MPTNFIIVILIAGTLSLILMSYNLQTNRTNLLTNIITGLIILGVLGFDYYPVLIYGKIAKIPVGSDAQNFLYDSGQLILLLGTFGLIITGLTGIKKKKHTVRAAPPARCG